ncbi:serine/threonine-protein kinase [Bradymonas sediminis]|uniref:Protein kinase domain-containing protein n=1 Tax=Bradymonas sediminis TaxID=1548548 RepID=A0A2Z4FGH6_9DELT|nr:serine/threonine-protein kinase [Bradymonas sediminis]AWV88082.1 hypothetical protein DN745_01530 [Bradymonas sediminis]TDP77205.1 serine/threonine-protein kinase [Bradymonas sediminis]
MLANTTDRVREEKLRKFNTLWESMAVGKTEKFEADRTRTMRPSTDLASLDASLLLSELPWLTQNQTQIKFAEISLGALIGEGGMGKINQAHQRSVAREVAVKSLHKNTTDPEAILTLLREGWITGRLEHPNIVPIYTLGRASDGQPLIVMKKIAGVSLADLMVDPSVSPRSLGTKQPLDFYIEILAQVCNAVHYAHSRGILHRDIKPENIMVGEFGEVYLLDWGIAVSMEETHEGRLPLAAKITSPAGTPAYMAPEMVNGDGRELSEKTDIFLLGAVLHEILTGEPPNKGDTLFQIMFDAYNAQPPEYSEHVDAQLAAICHRAMHADPAQRYASADALRNALETHLSHRDSLRIGEQSQERLALLREMVTREITAQADADAAEREHSGHAIYRLFGACRFGFEQALQTSPDNAAARRGLQEVLELLVERELQQGAHRAAALLLADLPEPNPALEARLAELTQRNESREREFEGLKRKQFEHSTAVGRRSRSLYAAVLGILLGALAIVSRLALQWAGVSKEPSALLIHSLAILVTTLVPTIIARRALMLNLVNRNLVYLVFISLGFAAFFRGLGLLLELPPSTVMVMEMTGHSAIGLVAALFADRQMLWISGAMGLGALAGGFFPEFAIPALVTSIFVGFTALALGWRRVDRRASLKTRES